MMVLVAICIIVMLAAIIANAFNRNINGVLGFSLALFNYIVLQIVISNTTF